MFCCQRKTRMHKIIDLFTQLCEVWNKWVFIATNRFCLNRLIYTPTCHHCDIIIFSDVIRRHVTFQTFTSLLCVSRTIQYLHRCLKTKDPFCREQYNIYTDAWKQKTLYSGAKEVLIPLYLCFTRFCNLKNLNILFIHFGLIFDPRVTYMIEVWIHHKHYYMFTPVQYTWHNF